MSRERYVGLPRWFYPIAITVLVLIAVTSPSRAQDGGKRYGVRASGGAGVGTSQGFPVITADLSADWQRAPFILSLRFAGATELWGSGMSEVGALAGFHRSGKRWSVASGGGVGLVWCL